MFRPGLPHDVEGTDARLAHPTLDEWIACTTTPWVAVKEAAWEWCWKAENDGEHRRSSDGFLCCQSFERIVAVSFNLRASKATCRCLNWQLDARSYLDTSPVDVQPRQYTKQEGKWLLIDCRFYQMVAPKVQNTMQDSCDANRKTWLITLCYPELFLVPEKLGPPAEAFPWHLSSRHVSKPGLEPLSNSSCSYSLLEKWKHACIVSLSSWIHFQYPEFNMDK